MRHTEVLQEGICQHYSSSRRWGLSHACNLKGNSLRKAMRSILGRNPAQPQLAPCSVLVDQAWALCSLAVDSDQPVKLPVRPPGIQCLWNREVFLLHFNLFILRARNQGWKRSCRCSWSCLRLFLRRCFRRLALWRSRAPRWRLGWGGWFRRSLLLGLAGRLSLRRARTSPFARHLFHLDELLVMAFACWMSSSTDASRFAHHGTCMPTRA